MKTHNNIILFILTLLTITLSCQKEPQITPTPPTESPTNPVPNLTIQQAQHWLNTQNNNYLKNYPIRWQNAKSIATRDGNRIVLYLPGQPTFQHIKQGYRQLSIQTNPQTQNIEGKIIEIIPDIHYFQKNQKVDQADFTGRILQYDLNYKLQQGSIYAEGKQIGESRPATAKEKLAFQKSSQSKTTNTTNTNFTLLGTFDFPQNQSTHTSPNKTAYMQSIQVCAWVQSSYFDAEGIFNIYTERICTTYSFDNGLNYNDIGINHDPRYEQGGGGGGGNTTTAPEPANLPGEESQNIDPKKMTKCFSTIPDQGAAFQVKILVQEPLPGTSFNVGPNSFGHVAIQLTKQKGDASITQVLGFYPSGSGLSKLISNSTMKDNSDMAYDMSASYFTTSENFQKILGYVANPPTGYHFTDYNCASFVYHAAQAGGLSTPNPTTQIGFSGPGGAGYAMTPSGMATALRAQKAANPGADITSGGGTAPASKGECNEE